MFYRIIADSSTNKLASLINDKLVDGWELQGGVIIDKDGRYCQAMVKRKNSCPKYQ